MDRRSRTPREESSPKIIALVKQVEDNLMDALAPVCLTQLDASERRQVHRHFDHSTEYATKTYKITENEYELRVYPVGNLRRLAERSAEQAIKTGQKVALPPMSSYERFIIHEVLKGNDAVKGVSHGEGAERHIEIEPELYGRSLKKMIKKIKLI
ncbi:MAG TPA: R3H domain-containing nucleic acid-binding protein [bacterium]|nr:R3H domain-containing nucleic acid-binding protein [bacterium]HQG45347.1 R3H domain-containing nucleic acid-binding protein [bacterium]HQI47777.1 R3H domain-containing nucleic acid-binding protein [bacterium]HQJ63207.1 R3H domain-containing nucleic acid-binding protein [bacterium]